MGAHSTLTPAPASFEALRRKYASALAEWDATPPWYRPRWQVTPQGKALFFDPADARQAEINAGRARDAERRAARELRERQRQHPLYNTHHRDRLLQTWAKTGEPAIPPKALQGFTDWVMRHANALEDDVRQYAKTLEKSQIQTITERLGKYADRFYRDKNPAELTQRNLRRALRSAFRQFNEQSAHILQLVGKDKQRYVSNETKKARRHQLSQQQKWIEATTVTAPDKTLPLKDCIRTAEHRFAELYTLVKGQEEYFTSHGLIPMFTTLTCPAEFHPNPTNGHNSWDGSTPTDSHVWFNNQWQKTRAYLAKIGIRLEGFRVTEPHADGAEHWHAMMYVKEHDITTVQETIVKYFGHSEHAVRFKVDFLEKGKASAAGYMLKYLVKTINAKAILKTSAANDPEMRDDADGADAWRSTWHLRAFQFFGAMFGKQTLWRELRRITAQPTEPAAKVLWRAARGGRAALFLSHIITDAPELAVIREVKQEWTQPDPTTGETEPVEKKGRIVGIEINHIRYITHDTRWTLETDYTAFREDISAVTVIHKAPRGGMEGSPFAHAPPNGMPKTEAA